MRLKNGCPSHPPLAVRPRSHAPVRQRDVERYERLGQRKHLPQLSRAAEAGQRSEVSVSDLATRLGARIQAPVPASTSQQRREAEERVETDQAKRKQLCADLNNMLLDERTSASCRRP
jgi:hypothetical protein